MSPAEAQLLLNSAITVTNYVRQAKVLEGKDQAKLQEATIKLIEVNRGLEDTALALSDAIMNEVSEA